MKQLKSAAQWTTLMGLVLLSGAARSAAKDEGITFEIVGKGTQRMGNQDVPQTVSGKCSVKGNKARADIAINGQIAIMLVTSDAMYMLAPQSKTGMKFPKVDAGTGSPAENMMMKDPRRTVDELKKQGAKKVGSEKVGTVTCDVYQMTPPGTKTTLKTWVRLSDGFPVKKELKGDGVKIVTEFKNYKKGMKLADSLFTAPKDYEIQEYQAPTPTNVPGAGAGPGKSSGTAPKKK